jgi:FkbM family methyltransferase
MNNVIFDIGANMGTSCFHFLDDVSNTVYAFEPTPYLLENFLYPRQSERYKVVPYAVSNFNGEATFNISGQYDWGCSSLSTFSEDLEHTWPGRDDFKVTDQIKVNVIRLDTFIKENNIDRIDFLHCDTQGNDYKVLESLGDYIDILQSGEVEAFYKNPLYKDIDNSVENVTDFLQKHNFKIVAIAANDQFNNEVNIYFKK